MCLIVTLRLIIQQSISCFYYKKPRPGWSSRQGKVKAMAKDFQTLKQVNVNIEQRMINKT